MKPRPIYRWKSFWFGLLVLVFMGWAWVDSGKNLSSVLYYTGADQLAVARWQSETHLVKLPYFDRKRGFDTSRQEALEPAFDLKWEVKNLGGAGAEIPDAAVFFPFLLVWIGWLWWRWRRLRKLPSL